MKLWIISDTHFWHKNIVKYCNRPKNHEDLMIKGLHKISPEDTLYHLGDFAFGTINKVRERWWSIMPQCKKIFIEGNHDKRSRMRLLPWDEVFRLKEQPVFLDIYNKKIALAHKPEKLEEVEADVYIHGHIHNLGQKIYWKNGRKWINACVEQWAYEPFLLSKEILWEKMN